MLTELMLHAHWGQEGHWSWMDGPLGGFEWLFVILMMVFWIALLVLVVAGAYWVVKGALGGGDEAEQILRERFARGEIDEEEYVERKEKL